MTGIYTEDDFPKEQLVANADELIDEGLQPMRADGTIPNERLGSAIADMVMSRDASGKEPTTAQEAAEAFGITPMRAIEAVTCGSYFCFVNRAETPEQSTFEWDGM